MEFFSGVKAYLFDLNGVFFVDGTPLEGAAETIEMVKARDIPRRFITNTTTRSLDTLHHALNEMGLPVDKSEIISPGRAAVMHLRKLGKPRCHLLLNEDTKKDFAEFPTSHTNPDVIVIGDIGEKWNYQILNQAFEMLMYGARLIALHKGRYWQTGKGLKLDIGAFVSGLEYATGRKAEIIGKPTSSFFEAALESLGSPAGETAMLGDDIESDVGGAQAAGLKGVLMKTGKYRPEIVSRSMVRPDAVLENIGELREHLGA